MRAEALIYLAGRRTLAATRRDVAYFRLCGLRPIIGAPLTHDLITHRIDAQGDLELESARLTRTLSALGHIDLGDHSWWDLRLSESERAVAEEALRPMAKHPFIVVNTGGKAKEKDWGEPNWTSMLTLLGSSLAGYGLVFVGGDEDSERGTRLRQSWPAAPVLDLCGRLTPRESAAVIERSDAFVGHDSGPLHLASAVGTPCVGLFGNYNQPKLWHPTGPNTHIIHCMDGLSSIAPGRVAGAVLGITRSSVC